MVPIGDIANDLGDVGTSLVTTLYTIVHAQQSGVYFDGRNEPAGVPSLWASYFESDIEMVDFFIKDRSNETGSLDHKILTDSIAVGGNDYRIITTLSARQAFAGMVLLGTPENSYLFLKEISSNGNCQTVDVIFPAIPIFLYLNPELIKFLLEPLYEHQEAGKYPNSYAIHDLGAHYPQFIGHSKGDDEGMPLEECGNMIIMTLSYAQRMNDTNYLRAHYPILKQWVGYLVDEALIPADQLSTDDFQGTLANQTNLALKGIIAIEAMSVISHLIGHEYDRQKFTNIAHNYISKWEELAVIDGDKPHTNLAYGNNTSYGLLYNLYGDRLLGLNLVPQRIYDIQSNFYPTIIQPFGAQLDSRNLATKYVS
ncbi:Glutaminase A [Erysiphe neolycopersici]|uniref:Glutaminase A n=1 Tax=Erysiphe neolycopersici TaxID=212602 RepID=A0A420HVX1_9PEZI|nr:Glutaminase A [Erysiphe neolycopersici]